MEHPADRNAEIIQELEAGRVIGSEAVAERRRRQQRSVAQALRRRFVVVFRALLANGLREESKPALVDLDLKWGPGPANVRSIDHRSRLEEKQDGTAEALTPATVARASPDPGEWLPVSDSTRDRLAAQAPRFVPLQFARRSPADSIERARAFYDEMNRRRTTRHFSTDPVPEELIEYAVRTAGTAPSGAHQQPWTFVAVSDPETKRLIREAAEKEEHQFYHGRAPDEWIEALAPLGTDEHKPHLTDAPWVVVLFRQAHGLNLDGTKRTYYYTQESCGIAAGFFIAAVHLMGLVTLTHTPNPMGFLAETLGRPANEKAMLVMPVGYPAANAAVPDLRRKPLEHIATWR